MSIEKQKLDELMRAVDFCRAVVLDSVEMELVDSDVWPSLRRRILRAFGDFGLTQRIKVILTPANQEGGFHDQRT